MHLSELTDRALQIRERFAAQERTTQGRPWTRDDIMQGFIVDVGDLMRLTMAKRGARHVPDVDRKLAHELSDCLWSILVLAKLHDVDLEAAFTKTMDEIEAGLATKEQTTQ